MEIRELTQHEITEIKEKSFYPVISNKTMKLYINFPVEYIPIYIYIKKSLTYNEMVETMENDNITIPYNKLFFFYSSKIKLDNFLDTMNYWNVKPEIILEHIESD